MTWEEIYCYTGVLYIERVFKLDFSKESWKSFVRPPFSLYLHGLSYSLYILLHSFKKHRLNLNLDNIYDDGMELAFSPTGLFFVRLPTLILGSLCPSIVYLICNYIIGDWRISFLASFILSFAPHFISQTSVASLDGDICFFYLMTRN